MSSSYPWIKDSNTLTGTPPADRVAVNSPNGLYFSTSTNSSILAPTNSNLTIETAGTGDVIVKTNSNNRLTIDDSGTVTSAKNIVVTDGALIVNNTTGTGGTSNPLLTLNQTLTTGGTLVTETYNQKTTAIAEFCRQSYYAKNNSSQKNEFSRISQSISNTANRGQIDFYVNEGSLNNPQPYLTMNGNVTKVLMKRDLDMQYKNISNVPSITTSIPANSYATQHIEIYNSTPSPIDLDTITTPENGLRYVLTNNLSGLGNWADAVGLGVNPLPTSDDPTASAYFQGYWFVGTQQGNLYYSSDSGNSWSNWGNVGGRINVLYPYNSGSYLAVGGNFTSPYYNAFWLDSGLTANDFSNSDGGFNGEVWTFCDNNGSSILYIGGAFSQTYNSSYTCYYWWNWDYGMNNGYIWDNGATSGFSGGAIRTIVQDTNSGYFIVGGDFTDFNSSFVSYLMSLNMSGINLGGFFGFGFIPNNQVYTIQTYSSGILVGGGFDNSNYWSSCNTQYAFYSVWNGTNWDGYDYPFLSPSYPIPQIWYEVGNYYTLESGGSVNLYRNSDILPALPTGSTWVNVISYGGSYVLFATNNQSSVGFPYYYLDSNSTIGISINTISVVNNGTEYGSGNTITLPTKGTSIELIYQANPSYFFVISNNGATGIGGGGSGGISTISAGSGISVSSPTGPTTTISNSGVLSLTAGSNISLSATTGNITISASGGGGGGDVYWSQLNDAYSTYANLASGSSYNNPYSFGLNDTANWSITMELNTYETNYLNVLSTQQSPYLRVGQQTTGANSGYYTLLAGVNDIPNNDYTTLATINSNMHLYANKSGNTLAQATGKIYLYGVEILPGNDIFNPLVPGLATTFLGTSTYYWREVNSALFNQVSDIKLKENIITLDSQFSVDFIKSINPVSYTFKNDEKQKTHFGVIAQEVKEILGDKKYGLHNDSGENQTVAYTEFIAPLIKSVQFLLQKVESLELQIKELQK